MALSDEELEQTIVEDVMEILRTNGFSCQVIRGVEDIATPELEEQIQGDG